MINGVGATNSSTSKSSRSNRAREVAEILVSNSDSMTPAVSAARYHPYNHHLYGAPASAGLDSTIGSRQDYLSEDVIAGSVRDGKMSAVRRFFCLFVTFDLLFTMLLWVICFVTTGENIKDIFEQQIVHYSLSSSLFDVVMCSACRFVVLILFYAILSINHWFVIALTTSCSCAFLVVKVFLYVWPPDAPLTLEVFLILSSFVTSWGQAWFLDFRVLPQESQAREFMRAVTAEEERQPLLFDDGASRASYRSTADIGDFYSPIESPQDSDDEQDGRTANANRAPQQPSRQRLSREDEEFVKKAQESMTESWKMINSEGWKDEKKTPEGDLVQSKIVRRTHKIFKITGTVDLPPRILYEELANNIANLPKWNPTLLECRLLKHIDDKTSISYQVAAEGAGGIVSSRDFVNLRYCDIIEGNYVCSGMSVTLPEMPAQKGHVRGENGPGCWVMRPVAGKENQCVFQWLLDTNLKGWIPQSIIDSALSFAMCDYIGYIRTYGVTLRNEGRF